MSLIDRLRFAIINICRDAEDIYEDLCKTLEEDVDRYEEIIKGMRIRRRGGE